MIRKLLSVLIVAALVFTYSVPGYASVDEGSDMCSRDAALKNAEECAEIVEDIAGTDDVSTDIVEERDSYEIEGEYESIDIPIDGSESIEISGNESGDSTIEMGLPEEVEDVEGIMTDSGTIVYDSDEDVVVSVQANQYTCDNEVTSVVKELITIESCNAPREYEFDFDLPEGHALALDYNVDIEAISEYACGAVYILNEFDIPVSYIEPAWAVDSKGEKIDTWYSIDGDTLIQVVDFSDESSFPILADPKHMSKTHYETKTVKNNKNGREFLAEKRRGINDRQDDKLGTVASLLAGLVGITTDTLKCNLAITAFNGFLGVASDSRKQYLEDCEDALTLMEEKASTNRKIHYIEIDEPYYGAYVKHAKHYIWTAGVPFAYYEYNHK